MEEKRSNSLLLSFMNIFKHADVFDCFLITVGYLGAIFDGLSQSILNVLFAKLFNNIGMGPSSPNFIANMNLNASRFLYLGAGSLVVSFLERYCCTITAERLTSRMRARYLKAVMRQDVGYFDVKMASTAEVINMVSNDSLIIQDVLCEKAPNFIMNCSFFIGNYVVAFILLWRLALVAFPTLLLLIIPGLICGQVLLGLTRKIHTEYDKATIIVEQALSAIRTVYSSTAELHTISAFSAALDCSVRLFLRQDLVKSLAIGSNNVIFAIYAFIFWYGSHLVQHHGQALGIGLSNVKYFVEAMSAAERIMKVIKQRPMIDSESSEGEQIGELKGEVEFREVRFSYPSRPDIEVFKGFNLIVEARKTMALMGESGSGKSTLISLLQRFYDPTTGEILLDRVNIRKLRLKWLRAQMGLVSQEPVLFATSIKENILFGKEDATMEEIITAAKAAKADEFITHLPSGYATLRAPGRRNRLSCGGHLAANRRLEDAYHVLTGRRLFENGF
ncbi:hypothetical protein KFK09_017612 [Dendrobium nobile]|uniref:ABC transmembrane type-1 domain-containing protein n=1 Tax=Dendrobium nobile TaxID=94219 RepID=A0A8T3B1F8_DENNO|nr:hypothetical protein KFK09_017612 [Dendrobium nobile]